MATQLDPPLHPGEDHLLGTEAGGPELLMYGDFECPYCQAAQSIVARVRRRVGPELVFAFRHFPLEATHPRALASAQASEAAAARGRFWEMHDALYAQRGVLDDAGLRAAASAAGVDADEVLAEVAEGRHEPRVRRDLDGAIALHLRGTPAFFANGQLVEGSFDAGSLVEALRVPRTSSSGMGGGA